MLRDASGPTGGRSALDDSRRGAVMESESTSSEVSFFKLAEQYEMATTRRRRWRDSRDTMVARRHRRRQKRRARTGGSEYYPLKVDAASASRGIRTRLFGAIAAAVVTVVCVLSIVLAPQITLGSLFPFTVGVGSFALSVSLIMSARREEIVHQVAGQLTADTDDVAALPSGSSSWSAGALTDRPLPTLDDVEHDDTRRRWSSTHSPYDPATSPYDTFSCD